MVRAGIDGQAAGEPLEDHEDMGDVRQERRDAVPEWVWLGVGGGALGLAVVASLVLGFQTALHTHQAGSGTASSGHGSDHSWAVGAADEGKRR